MAPAIRFVGQPFAPGDAAASTLRDALADGDTRHLSVAVAWTRFGGLVRIADDLRAFRARGGRCKLITGIDEGGATRPGLALALLLFDEVRILHDTGGRTFHPKLYLAEGPSSARLLVGSSNLTAGGLYFNFEASVEARFALPCDGSHPALVGARDYLLALERDACCRALTPDVLEALARDARYRIAPTERRRAAGGATATDPRGADTDAVPDEPAVAFSPSSGAATLPPRLDRGQRQLLDELEGPVQPRPAASQPTPSAEVAARWVKVLNRTDAQHPPNAASNPTGNLRLSQARQRIDHRTWFRQALFAGCDWRRDFDSKGNAIETALVEMDATLGGAGIGTVEIRLDHAPHREAGQNNVPTIMHWGPVLGPMLRAVDLTGSAIAIERLATGAFRMTIA
jgi:hypothetical protein